MPLDAKLNFTIRDRTVESKPSQAGPLPSEAYREDESRFTRPAAAAAQSSLPIPGARRLFVLLVLAATIPMLLFGTSVIYVAADQTREAARQAASNTLDRVADKVTLELDKVIEVATTLAALPSLDQPELERFTAEAQRIAKRWPLVETVSLADSSGTQLLNILRAPGEPLGPVEERASFEAVLQTQHPVIGGIGSIGPVSGKRLVSLAVPVTREGRLRFVLMVGLPPSGIQKILKEAGAPKGWVGVIVDSHGNVVARSIGGERDIGKPASVALRQAITRASGGFYSGRRLDGVEVETVYRILPDTGGWSVHFGIPSAALNGPVSRSLGVLAAGCLASMALAGGLAHLIARDLAQRRLHEHERAALALAASEERGAVAIEAAELGTWRWNVPREDVVVSERTRAMLGLPRAAAREAETHWSSKQFLATVHSSDRPLFLEAVNSCVENGVPVDLEFRALFANGRTPWLRAIGRAYGGPSRNGRTGVSKVIHGVLADIEPRTQAEKERVDLLRRLSETQEKEQQRIARELHDQVGQTVTGLALGLKGLQQKLDACQCSKEAGKHLQWLQTLTNDIGRDIHRAASDLRPTALDDLGLVKALGALASDWSTRYSVAVDIQTVGLDDRLPPEVETCVYRIVQEALTNVLKHAAAQNVSVVLERRFDRLRVVIEDDGQGFLQSAARKEDGDGPPRLGLSSIRERLALIGGSMRLESTPGAGTGLFIQVPLVKSGFPV